MENNKYKFWVYISLLIPLLCIFFYINYFTNIIPFIKIHSSLLFAPLYLCPIGIIISIFTLRNNKNLWIKLGLALNIVLTFLLVCFILFGIYFMVK